MTNRILPATGVLLSLIALSFTIWIVVPAPATVFWLVSVVASEWSLHFGLAAALGTSLSLVSYRRQKTRPRRFGIAAGILATAFAAYPTLTSISVAADNGVSLALGRYVFGSENDLPTVETYEYRQVDGQSLNLDVYGGSTEAVGVDARPAVVVVHGGSWRSGVKSDFPEWNSWLVGEGFVVFDIEYRLSPQPNWETATVDVQEAVRWIKFRAGDFGVDASRIALMGRSAGGHLVLQAAYTAGDMVADERAANTANERDSDSVDASVQAVVAFYPPTDLAWSYMHPANQRVTDGPATLRQFTGETPTSAPEVYSQASPTSHVTSDSPPTLLLHGRQDQLVRVDNSIRLYGLLKTLPVSDTRHQALLIPYAQHGFDYNFDGWGSQMTQSLLRTFLIEHLGLAAEGRHGD